MNVIDRRQTDRPRYGEMCSSRRNHLCCKKWFHWRRIIIFHRFVNRRVVEIHMYKLLWTCLELTCVASQGAVARTADYYRLIRYPGTRPGSLSGTGQVVRKYILYSVRGGGGLFSLWAMQNTLILANNSSCLCF